MFESNCRPLSVLDVWEIPYHVNTALRAVMIDGEVVEVIFFISW